MKNSEKAFNDFKESYQYKMGGTQTVILPNGKSKFFDDREYYSGRGTKYNKSIRHDSLGDIKISRKRYSHYLSELKEIKIRGEKLAKKKQLENLRILEAKNKGVYSLNDGYIELSDKESVNQYFSEARLAKTLDISIEDAVLLNSGGKTYVFAIQISTKKLIRLYHPSLDCNDLSISFDFVSEKVLKDMNHDKWINAPYSDLVGQTLNANHFVC